MEYTPTQPSVAPPPPTYELKKDMTGKPTIKRGPQILKDSTGKEVRVPFPPNSKCKRCYGRGYVGINVGTDELLACKKCFPMI